MKPDATAHLANIARAAVFYRTCAEGARNSGNLADDERRAREYDRIAASLEWARQQLVERGK